MPTIASIPSKWAPLLTITSIPGQCDAMLTIVSIKSRIFNREDLGRAIKQTRRERRLTQVDLARHAQVARGVIQKIESGRGDLNMATLFKLLQVLSLDLTIASRSDAGARLLKEREQDA